MSNDPEDVTLLLERVNSGDRDAAERLFSLIYDELRQLASSKMRNESAGHTLQSTALVHEAWIKIACSCQNSQWKNRGHFFAAASLAMRRVLVDAARARQSEKRGGTSQRLELRDDDYSAKQDEEILALNEALEQLQLEDPVKAELVNLRFFGGFTNKQAAEQLGVSTATAERHWTFARAWLRTRTG